jgi:hypothetical protein
MASTVTTVATDTFARASLGANWAATTSSGCTLGIIASTAIGVTGGGTTVSGLVYWAGTGTFTGGQFSQIAISNVGANPAQEILGPAVYIQAPANTCYWAPIISGNIFIQKMILGVPTNLINVAYTPTIGDVVRIEAEVAGTGTIIRVYINGVGKVAVVDSSSPFTSGTPGIGGFNFQSITSMQASSWAAGNLTTTLATYFSDNFTRANESPLSDGGQWGIFNENLPTQLQLVSNKAEAITVSTRNTSLVAGTNFGSDQWIQATIGTFNAVSVQYLLTRASGTGGTNQAYRFDYDGGGHIRLLKQSNGAFTTFVQINGTFANGDSLLFTASGSILTGYQNGNAILAWADTSYTSGQPGIGINPGTPITNATFSSASAGDFGTPLLLQAKMDTLNTTALHTNAYPKNVTAGNLLVVAIACYNTGFTGTTVTDTLGNSYSLVPAFVGTSGGLQFAYAISKASGANTVSTTVNVAGANNQIIIAEYKIPGPFDVKSQAAAGTGAFTSNPTATTGYTQELLIGTIFQRTLLGTITATPGWNLRAGQPNTSSGTNIALFDQVVSGKAAYAFTGSGVGGAGQWVAGIYTFNLQALNANLLMMMGAGT